MSKKVKRTNTGQFKKGVSGNPSGRPKTSKMSQKDKNALKELITSNDIQGILGFLCERANDIDQAFKYIKEFAPYLAPKLQTIQKFSKNDKTITIEWKQAPVKQIEDIDAAYEELIDNSEDKGIKDAVLVEDKEKVKEIEKSS